MGPEELGSVYESLLELVPQITQDGRGSSRSRPAARRRATRARRRGSYYTPDSLVQVLLDSALEPVVADTIAANPEQPGRGAARALRSSTPPAAPGTSCSPPRGGSRRTSRGSQANGTPSAAEYRHALRQVVGRCIYGVDLNPMAVELCKVSLWMEAVEPGLPLTFLDSHIQHGNALLGTTPELMADGIPDAAWDPIEGDDKKIASALKKRNKKAAAGQRGLDSLWSEPATAEASAVARAVAELEAALGRRRRGAGAEGVAVGGHPRHRTSTGTRSSSPTRGARRSCGRSSRARSPTLRRPTSCGGRFATGRGSRRRSRCKTTSELAEQYRFFHWHLQFPQVFATGGFDVVLGNPPWERVKLQEAEWFAQSRPDIAMAPNAAARKRLIA